MRLSQRLKVGKRVLIGFYFLSKEDIYVGKIRWITVISLILFVMLHEFTKTENLVASAGKVLTDLC